MTREEAYQLTKPRFSNKNLFKHVLAVEAVMRELALYFDENVEKWGLAGLLHDLDYEETVNIPEKHTLITEELLKDTDVPDDVIYAIKAHNNIVTANSLMDKALFASDPVTGLIVAAALMHPDKKLKSLDAEFVLRRFKVKSFARGANREQIETCSQFGLSLEEFVALAIAAMQKIDQELGL